MRNFTIAMPELGSLGTRLGAATCMRMTTRGLGGYSLIYVSAKMMTTVQTVKQVLMVWKRALTLIIFSFYHLLSLGDGYSKREECMSVHKSVTPSVGN